MKITIKNLGAMKQAEFTLGNLTIICGGNNTGKTYATYALFGFLSFWRDAFSIKVPDRDVGCLLNEGSVELDIQDYIGNAKSILNLLQSSCPMSLRRRINIFPKVTSRLIWTQMTFSRFQHLNVQWEQQKHSYFPSRKRRIHLW